MKTSLKRVADAYAQWQEQLRLSCEADLEDSWILGSVELEKCEKAKQRFEDILAEECKKV